MDTRFEALEALFRNPETAAALLELAPEEAQVYLQQHHGLEFTLEELLDLAEGIKAAAADTSDELNPEQLEQVVGGGKSSAYYHGYYLGKAVIAGCVIVGGAAAIVTLGW